MDPRGTMVAMAGLAVASMVTMGTAMFYTQRQIEAAGQQSEQQMRQERRKYRDRYRKTAEFQRRKQIYEERKRHKEAQMQEVAYFNENDEMVLTKIEGSKMDELPAGFVKVNRGEPVGHYKVGKEITGEAFITNLENVNKRRVEQISSHTATSAATAAG